MVQCNLLNYNNKLSLILTLFYSLYDKDWCACGVNVLRNELCLLVYLIDISHIFQFNVSPGHIFSKKCVYQSPFFF